MTTKPEEWCDLSGKVAVVTGAAGGIGRAVVEQLAAAGAEIAAVDLKAGDLATGHSIACDVADATAVEALVAEVGERWGRLDLLVHCAGVTDDRVLWKLDDEAWRRVLAVNLDSAFYLLKHGTGLLRDGGGSVVLVSSINGERGKFGQANYAASKAGVVGLMRTAARELGRFGVRVNAVAPGFIRTPMTGGLPGEIVERAREETVLGRLGEPEDVAGAILFLCSPLARHVTGQVLRVDGGQLIG